MPERRSIPSARNGRKSKGPVTPQGKARSARNAEKHGMSSSNFAITPEDVAALHELRREFHITYKPTNPQESKLVDVMAFSEWRRHRLLAVEAATFEQILADPGSKSTHRRLADLCRFQSCESDFFHLALARLEQSRRRDKNPDNEPTSPPRSRPRAASPGRLSR